MEVLELLRNLVEIPSPSGKEGKIVEYLVNLLEEIGYSPILLEKEGIKDIILNPSADVWIVTHLDTVPIKRKFEFDGTYAYGTGVCDTKGSITAILLALEEIDGLKFGVALLSDEEEGGRGSRIFVEEFGRARAIVMEPTSLRIANVHYGSLEILAKFRGVPAHGAMVEYGRNAIDLAIDSILRIRECMGNVKFLVQEMKGGGEEYVVPDECTVRMDFVFPPEVSLLEVKSKVIGILGDAEVNILEESEGFVSGEIASLLEDAVRTAGLKVEHAEMHSWTDAVNLKNAGWDVVVFGPGELQFCHTEMERIDPKEIVKAKDVLVALNNLIT